MLLYGDASPHLLFVCPVVRFILEKDKCIVSSLHLSVFEVIKAYKVD